MATPSSRLVRELLAEQCPDLADAELRQANSGWDNTMFRLGHDYVVRLPRKPETAHLLLNERRALPQIRTLLEGSSNTLAIPEVIFEGRPSSAFNYSWSIMTWLPGTALAAQPLRGGPQCLKALANFLTSLHKPAARTAPYNPHRGISLQQRRPTTERHLKQLIGRAQTAGPSKKFAQLLETEPWAKPPVWLHGDLHPGNLIGQNGCLTGVADWGDLCAGDPAVDLAVAWMLPDELARLALKAELAQLGHPADEATWRRAQGWALALALAHLHGSDTPSSEDFARKTVARAAAR